jgi:hypothetical protein
MKEITFREGSPANVNKFIEIKNVGNVKGQFDSEPKSPKEHLIQITKKYLNRGTNSITEVDSSPKSSVPTLKFENFDHSVNQSINSNSNKFNRRITKIQRIEGRKTVGPSSESTRKGSLDQLHPSSNRYSSGGN